MKKLDILLSEGIHIHTSRGAVVADSRGSDADLGLVRIRFPDGRQVVEYISTAPAILLEIQSDMRQWHHGVGAA